MNTKLEKIVEFITACQGLDDKEDKTLICRHKDKYQNIYICNYSLSCYYKDVYNHQFRCSWSPKDYEVQEWI